MEGRGVMRGKENHAEQQHQENGVRVVWDHATKLREAGDARRKRILARSSERLAFITGEANAIPTSPLLDKSNFFIQELSHHTSPEHESTMKKSLFSEHTEEGKQREAQKKAVNSRENPGKAVSATAQPLEKTDTIQAHECMNDHSITLKSKFRHCIKLTLLPRRIIAACIALALLGCGFTQSSHLVGGNMDTSLTFRYVRYGHLGRPDALFMTCSSLAIVVLVDLVVIVGAFFFFPGKQHVVDRKVMAKNGTLSMLLLHLLLSISLDCSVFASLLSGGFLVLSKYFPSLISEVA